MEWGKKKKTLNTRKTRILSTLQMFKLLTGKLQASRISINKRLSSV